MLGTLKIRVASAGHLKWKFSVPGTSKIKLEKTRYVSSKYLTGHLEIKFASTGYGCSNVAKLFEKKIFAR